MVLRKYAEFDKVESESRTHGLKSESKKAAQCLVYKSVAHREQIP